jgi:phage tail tape-measure protein
MKTIKISILAVSLGLMSFSAFHPIKESVRRTITSKSIIWKTESIDLGEIPQGTPKTIEFEFKNNTNKAVLITNVKTSCGCTAADYTKTAINPNEKGFVKATYNAAGAGTFSKTVTVTTNAEETPKVLTFKGAVVAKK